MTVVDRLDDLWLERPDQPLAIASGSNLREGSSPSPASDESKLHAFAPAPRTFSARPSRGHLARAGTSSGSCSPAAKRSAPAQAIIEALSVHSQPGGTLKRRPHSLASPASASRICWF